MAKNTQIGEDAQEDKSPAEHTPPEGYVIASGKALTSPRGILSSGAECAPADFPVTFDELVAKGYIVAK